MAVREVLRMGDARLLNRAEPVAAFDTPELHALVQDLSDTMRALNGAGLAAPQIGVSLQVVIFEVVDNPRYPEAAPIPFTVLINPELTPLSDEMEAGWEGCLSLPGLRGLVPRHKALRYRGFDQYGQPIDRTVEGFHARVVQHETDHLLGILYPMRMPDMRQFGFTDVLFPDMQIAKATLKDHPYEVALSMGLLRKATPY
jgi:peptide deformylase